MNILRLDHAALLVKDVERSRQFYRQILGMDEIPGLGAIWLAKGSAQLHLLGESQEGRAAQASGTYHHDDLAAGHTTHLAFEVDDLEEAQRHLKEQHVGAESGCRDSFLSICLQPEVGAESLLRRHLTHSLPFETCF